MEREPGQQERAQAVNTPPAGARTAVRPPPAPRPPQHPPVPSLATRVVALVFKPESWAEALRFPFRYTLLPLLVVALIAGVLTGIGFGVRFYKGARNFAAGFDARYPAMTWSGGKLTVEATDPPVSPIRFTSEGGTEVVIDPTEQVTTKEFGDGAGVLISSEFVYQKLPSMESKVPLKEFEKVLNVPEGTVINGTYLMQRVREDGKAFATTVGFIIGFATFLKESLWAALMMLMVAPMVNLAASSLRMRFRVACRAAGAITVPLIMLGGIFAAIGISPLRVMGADMVPLFWFIAAAGLACWTGIMASRMYRVVKQPPRQQ